MATSYCENCGEELTSLFCEVCGSISSNIPNSLSNDDSLAGLLANVINQGKQLSFSQIKSITKSTERTFRIFAQLEKTNNFLISKQADEYIISLNMNNSEVADIFIKEHGNNYASYLIKSLLELFPLEQDELSDFFKTPVNRDGLKKLLGKNYSVKSLGKKTVFEKKD